MTFKLLRKNQEQLRKVQERQALLQIKKKEAQKMQMPQKIVATDIAEEVKITTKVTEKPQHEVTENPQHEMPKCRDQGNKLRDNVACESDEEGYWEEEQRKRDNCASKKDYNHYVQKELEQANFERLRMCSIDKIPTINEGN